MEEKKFFRSQKESLEVVNFTNIMEDEDFSCSWGGEKEVVGIDNAGHPVERIVPTTYVIKAGETKPFTRFLAEHFAKHLAVYILRKNDKKWDDGPEKDALIQKMIGQVVDQAEMRVNPETLEDVAKREEFTKVKELEEEPVKEEKPAEEIKKKQKKSK